MPNKNLYINSPSTPFPMEAKLIERLQPEIFQKWRAMDVYRIISEKLRTAETFTLHDGPPFAAGEMHIGIGFNKILKDIILKYHSMRGKKIQYVPGWDCHGLPIESQVMNESRSEKSTLSVSEFRERCAANVKKYIEEQKEHFQTLGIFADWDRPYLTMSPFYEAGVLDVLAEVLDKGYIYRGSRPVHWCHICQTVLADAEIKEQENQRVMRLVPFRINGEIAKISENQPHPAYLFVPVSDLWVLPSCTALKLDPQLNLTIFSGKNSRGSDCIFIVEETALKKVSQELGASTVIRNVTSEELRNYQVTNPITGNSIPLILEEASRERSSYKLSLVAPAHSVADYNLALKHDLEIIEVVDSAGNFNEEYASLAGQNIHEAEVLILNLLSNAEILPIPETITRKELYGGRCGHSTYMLLTKQWFVKIDHKEADSGKTLRQKALKEVDELIRWIRKDDGEELHRKIEDRPDWCISRQRKWGVPIPTIICSHCKEILLKTEVVKVVRDLVALHGSQIWFTIDFPEFLSKDGRLGNLKCDNCGKKDFLQDPDINVLDVWFESGASWRSALIGDYRLSFPADLCIEGREQHHGWFQTSLLLALIIQGRGPFKNALTHGMILDEKQQTMRKVDQNFVTLRQALQEVPVDLIRLYFVYNRPLYEDFPLSIPSILTLESEYRTFRNCFRYLLGNLKDFVVTENTISLNNLSDIDKWIMIRLHRLIKVVTEDYTEFKFKSAIKELYNFCNGDLSKVYFEAIKDTLYNEPADSTARRSAQTAMHAILMALVKMLAPILVYTCEEVWGYCPGTYDCRSVHTSSWPSEREGVLHQLQSEDDLLEKDFNSMLTLRNALQIKCEKEKSAGTFSNNFEIKLTLYVLPASKAAGEFLIRRIKDLPSFFSFSEVVMTDAPEGLEQLEELPGVLYRMEKSTYSQCLRCRRVDPSVGQVSTQPVFCSRCVRAVSLSHSSYRDTSTLQITAKTLPAELANYMRQFNIRKIAFLFENGKVVPYYFHLPSQKTRINANLQPLADYLMEHNDFKAHKAVLMGLGEHTDVLFGIGIHQLKHGTPLGGTREFAYQSVGEMLENLLRLSYGMSIKNAIANIPHGGGKSIIDTCNLDLEIHRELRQRIYRDFGQFTASLFGRYICAEDMNNSAADTREMLAWCRHVMCLPEKVGGSGNPSRFTALVGWLAAKAGWRFWKSREGASDLTASLDDVVIAIQGVGNVGFNLIDILTEGETGLKKILIADIDDGQIENIEKLLQRKNKIHLLEIRSAKDPLLERSNSSSHEITAVRDNLKMPEDKNTYILYSKCDILIPLAVGNVIYEENVELLNCKVIVPIANNTYHDNDLVGRKIWDRGIVDVVEGNVNWGGATVAASELYGYDEDHVIKWCIEKIYRDTTDLLNESLESNEPPWDIKKREAEERMGEPHPIIKTAREGKFIVDISADFTNWIKDKWLPNKTSIGSSKFAEQVSKTSNDYLSSKMT